MYICREIERDRRLAHRLVSFTLCIPNVCDFQVQEKKWLRIPLYSLPTHSFFLTHRAVLLIYHVVSVHVVQ